MSRINVESSFYAGALLCSISRNVESSQNGAGPLRLIQADVERSQQTMFPGLLTLY